MLQALFPVLASLGIFLGSAEPSKDLIAAARSQIGVTVRYDSSYQRIPYPNGDVPMERGVCTDVLIRAYRKLGIDLQALVHQDMVSAWKDYPKNWNMKGPDANIDHRRVPNLATFFRRHGETLAISTNSNAFHPGDIVTWRLVSGVPHIGIVSDQKTDAGIPLIIHNIGSGTREEDILFVYTITGHFRYFPGSSRPDSVLKPAQLRRNS
jgi:hypothetical protein